MWCGVILKKLCCDLQFSRIELSQMRQVYLNFELHKKPALFKGFPSTNALKADFSHMSKLQKDVFTFIEGPHQRKK